jgi:hypothetical protein
LRREHFAVAAHIGVGALPRRMGRRAERVLPAEIVPVVDREGQDEEVLVARQFARQPIGLGAGRTALAGEQFEHRFRRLRQCRRGESESGDQRGKRCGFSHLSEQ